LSGWRGKQLAVKVSAAPVDGAANAQVIKVLAKALGVRARDISIVAGETSRDKTVAVEGCSREEVLERLRRVLSE